ncbi:MAG: hypothetical protein ABR569_04170 [Gaiellaceae bacterium]
MSVSRRNLRLVCAACIAASTATTFAVPVAAHRDAPLWPLAKAMTRIGGAKVKIGQWSGRVQPASTLCSGEGRGVRWSRTPHWRHFTCTWTVFDSHGGVDRDVTFRVHTITRTRFLISSARFGAD